MSRMTDNRAARRKDEGFASVAKVLDDEPGMVLVDFDTLASCGNDKGWHRYLQGRYPYRNAARKSSAADNPPAFSFDHSGEPRLRVILDDNDDPVMAYRPTPGSDWTQCSEIIWPAIRSSFTRIEPDNNTAVCLDYRQRCSQRSSTKSTWLAGHPRSRWRVATTWILDGSCTPATTARLTVCAYDAGKPSVGLSGSGLCPGPVACGADEVVPGQSGFDHGLHTGRHKVLFYVSGRPQSGGLLRPTTATPRKCS